MPVFRVCCMCAETFYLPPSRLKKEPGKYCSRQCAVDGRDKLKPLAIAAGISYVKVNHGQGSRLHRTWRCMKHRCGRATDISFKYYGAKGISVCEEWHTYFNFLKWAIESGYDGIRTLDRIDNTKGYAPDNCRWASLKEQIHNTKLLKITDAQVLEIRDMASKGRSRKSIAGEYGVSANYVSEILVGGRRRKLVAT